MADFTRRQFLGMGVASLLRLPSSVRTSVRPEYERSLSRALLCFPDASRDTGPEVLSRFLEAAFRDLRKVLPSYTSVHVAARQAPPGFEGANIARVEDAAIEIELWAQDLGETVVRDGRERFLVGRRMPPSMGPPSKMSSDRKRVAEIVFGEEAVLEAPFVFEGGNLAFDADRVLVGTNDVARTLACPGEARPRPQVLEDIAAAFGVGEAVEMGREPQTPYLQHIDQAFVLLGKDVAVACRLEGGGLDQEGRELQHYADQLRELGFHVFFIDHRASDLASYRSSINVVPFFDREAGRKRVLLPVFPGELREEATVVDRKALLGKAARAYDLYRGLGYEPSPIRDVTHPLGGNVHCVLNVLS